MMQFLIILLRLVHIFAGIFWTGVTFFMYTVMKPAVKDSGEIGGKFMQHLNVHSKMSTFMGATASLTFLSGFFLYWWLSGFAVGWITSPTGLVLTIGSLAGTIGWIYGFFTHVPLNARMKSLVNEIASAGGPPSSEQMAEMQQVGGKLEKAGNVTTFILVIAVLGMAIARYVV